MTFKLIDTPEQAVETVGAAMDRLRRLAYRVPPDEDGHGAVTWQEERDQLYGLLAEVGSLMHAIYVTDGTPYRVTYNQKLLSQPYIHKSTFKDLIGRIEVALGVNIMAASMDTRETRKGGADAK